MSCYILSNDNRFYAAVEQLYGYVAPVVDSNRLPAVKLTARQVMQRVERRDKTGSRTFAGIPSGVRKLTSFELSIYMTSWSPTSPEPSYGPLFLAALGGAALVFNGGTVESVSATQLRFTSSHGLSVGQGVSCGGEIRFVTALVDEQTVVLNAPFTGAPQAGWPVDRTITYSPATDLPSVSIYDYWSPESCVHRILTGAAIDKTRMSINGDFHEFTFSGLASDLLDSTSFEAGQSGLTEFPAEPEVAALDYSIIPGNLGQAWLGNIPDQFFTVTGAEILLDNNVDLRAREFGLDAARCIAAGVRSVLADVSLYEKPDAATKSLYQAARQRSPMSLMLQLGQQTAQLCGVYLKSVVPEVPEFIDDETRLEWRFRSCRAEGTIDDEIFVAFG
jgi:hypothetical protein